MNSQALDSDGTLSHHDSETSTADSDTLDDILSRYTCTCNPEFCVKLRRSVGSVSLRANRYFNGRLDRWAFVVKPADEEKHKWIHKLAVEPAYERASLSTSKIKLWQILRVQAVATYDWDTRRPGLQWRVTSKWSRGQGKLGRKEKLRYGGVKAVELHPHWRMDLFMPEVEGSLGGDRRDQNVHVEKGHCHLSVPKLEVLLDLNNVSSTKDDLAHLLRRVGRRDRKEDIGGPLPSAMSDSAMVDAVTHHHSSSSSTTGMEQQVSVEKVNLLPASAMRAPPAAGFRNTHCSWKDIHRQQSWEPTVSGSACLQELPDQRHPGHRALERLEHMWKQLTGTAKD